MIRMRKKSKYFTIIFLLVAVISLLNYKGLIELFPKSKTLTNATDENIEWAFTKKGQRPEELLIDAINSAERSLDVAIYSLTHPEIIGALKSAKQRGIDVRLIVDQSQTEGKSMTEAVKILGSAGITMKTNVHSGLMHLKMIIVDHSLVSTGSFNFTKAATTRNDENLVLIRNKRMAESFTSEFDRLWNDEKRFSEIRPVIAN